MIKTALFIILTFFAVIGFLECILSMLETVSTAKYGTLKKVSLTVGLSGNIENVTFLLNTLLIQAERITYKNCLTDVVIKDMGLDLHTLNQIHNFCSENKNISIEK